MNVMASDVISEARDCIICPVNGCDATPHMMRTLFSRAAISGVLNSTSGPGLIVTFKCENGHQFLLKLEDHSGCIWLSAFVQNEKAC